MIVPSRMLRKRQSAGDAWRNAASGGDHATPSVLVEDPLDVRDAARLEQREAEQHAGFLRVLVERRHEPELVIVELDVAADASGRDS